jgi:hypothetical protein
MTDETLTHDRRAHPRLHVRGAARFAHAGVRYQGRVENVSMGGVCVAVAPAPPVGALGRLDIPLKYGGVVVVAAEVVHSRTGCTGLRFHWAAEDDPGRHLLRAELGM